MLEALEASGRVGAVAYHVRGYPLVEHMRATVEAGELGELRVIHGRYVCDDALLVSGGWRLEPRELRPDLRHRRSRGPLVRPRRACHGRTHRRGARGLPHLRPRPRARGSRGAPAPLRQRRVRSRSVQRTRPRAQEPAALRARRQPRRFHLGPGDARTSSCTGTPRHRRSVVVKDPASNAGRAAAFARYPAGHAEGYGDAFRVILRDAYLAMAGEPHGSFPTFADGHRGMQVLEATLRSARGGGLGLRSRPSLRRGAAPGAGPDGRRRGARRPARSGTAKRPATALPARSPRA